MIELIGRASSSNVQKVLWALDELGLDYERRPLGGGFGGNAAPEYRALNPTGLVPTFREGDFVLWESDAILRHLARTRGMGVLMPEAPEAQALADQWTCWATTTLYPALKPLFFGVVRTPRAAQDLSALDGAAEPLAATVAILDAALAARPYLAGDAFSYGDIAPAINARRALNLPVGAPTAPNIAAWLARLAERPPFRRWVDVPMGTCLEEWREIEKRLG
jgi:glutathione S-transferase